MKQKLTRYKGFRPFHFLSQNFFVWSYVVGSTTKASQSSRFIEYSILFSSKVWIH